MELRKLAIVLVAAATAIGIGASAAPTSHPGPFDSRTPPGCFFVRDIGDRTVGGPHTLYFKVKDQSHIHAVAYFHLETKGECNTGPTASDEHPAFTIRPAEMGAGHAAMICSPGEVMVYAANYCPLASM